MMLIVAVDKLIRNHAGAECGVNRAKEATEC